MFTAKQGWCLALVAGWLAGAAQAADAPVTDKACLDCHSEPSLASTNAQGRVLSLFVDEARLRASRHGTNTCISCHVGLTADHPDDGVAVRPVDCGTCHRDQSVTYGGSAHALALKAGEAGAAGCKDCHGGHEVQPHTSASSLLHPANQLAVCGACHADIAEQVRLSVHGQALADGKRDAPACTDCHSEHRIQGLKGASSMTIAQDVCSRCHASERINTKYRLPSNRVQSFFDSYHGLATQLGSTRAANCASCHGVHNILPSADPRSSIHPDHLVETCGKCHAGVTPTFTQAKVHGNGAAATDFGARLDRLVRLLYLWLIPIVVGGFLLHNLLCWGRQALLALRSRNRNVLRMDRSQRVQHLVLVLSFVLLAVSGFALKFPESRLGWLLGGDESIRRWSHRVAALVLMGLGGYHVLYAALTLEGRRLVLDLLPRAWDLRELRANLRYLVGRLPHPPRFGRFSYVEKIEYWSVVWGTVIMGVTGLVIWIPEMASRILPAWAITVATTVHYYEAVLACLAILVWHGYHVILSPESYPINWAFFDGKVIPHGPVPNPPAPRPVPQENRTSSRPGGPPRPAPEASRRPYRRPRRPRDPGRGRPGP